MATGPPGAAGAALAGGAPSTPTTITITVPIAVPHRFQAFELPVMRSPYLSKQIKVTLGAGAYGAQANESD